METVLNIIYIFILIYTVIQLYKVVTVKSRVGKVLDTFSQKPRTIMIIASAALIVLGVVNIIQTRQMISLIYIFMGGVFLYLVTEKIIFSEYGIYFNGKMVLYEEIKKWQFDRVNGGLEIEIKSLNKSSYMLIPVKVEDIGQMQKIIKSFKSKKKK
ncbi:MAG: DUF5673 domain-containing protein [Finegoldia sp.]|nr:DUF5673 domain-containing protein [Finegoldia sp.]